ncbi:hypothetical protein P5673_030167 [Acropora cervicornis]|uniref:Uncharacterized protein n=1 Tax=Acropora cervicornis TaxID=6130 RepID=A0AAD9PUX3_ACRCE|nr:hypothetical protein P5673_030167 [Acropora cervicornis]
MNSLHLIQGLLLFMSCMSENPPKGKEIIKICTFTNNCSSEECCVKSLDNPPYRVCAKRPGLGVACSPALFPGLDFSCPCSHGLTCTRNPPGYANYTCGPVPEIEKETDHNNDMDKKK